MAYAELWLGGAIALTAGGDPEAYQHAFDFGGAVSTASGQSDTARGLTSRRIGAEVVRTRPGPAAGRSPKGYIAFCGLQRKIGCHDHGRCSPGFRLPTPRGKALAWAASDPPHESACPARGSCARCWRIQTAIGADWVDGEVRGGGVHPCPFL